VDERTHWRDPDSAAIRRLLHGPKPGMAAQARMATHPRPGWPPNRDIAPRQGGVLILLYPHEGQLYLVLTRRTETVRNHKGQVSLPGGRREGDEPIEQTALREAQEELGIVPPTVEVLGALTPLYIPPSDFCITPVVGWTGTRPDWRPDPVEVAEVIEVPLRNLADPATVHHEAWQREELTIQVPYFLVQGHRVWGATAMVLSEFLAVLAAVQGC
jgi:8-oxo-dGTP pyrophosphatase MutT (NUDIX family)